MNTAEMTTLTPLGADALQSWAAHCFQAAFAVGLMTGLLGFFAVVLGVLLARHVWQFACALYADWRLRRDFAVWEAGPEAAVLRAYADACDVCGADDALREVVLKMAEKERIWQEYKAAHGIDEGAVIQSPVFQSPVFDDGADDVRAEYGRLYQVRDLSEVRDLNEVRDLGKVMQETPAAASNEGSNLP